MRVLAYLQDDYSLDEIASSQQVHIFKSGIDKSIWDHRNMEPTFTGQWRKLYRFKFISFQRIVIRIRIRDSYPSLHPCHTTPRTRNLRNPVSPDYVGLSGVMIQMFRECYVFS